MWPSEMWPSENSYEFHLLPPTCVKHVVATVRRMFSFFAVAVSLFFLVCSSAATAAATAQAAVAAETAEKAKIEALIHVVETRTDLKFIRLGSVHSSTEAAHMLRVKLGVAGSRIKTANEFIEHVASATASGSTYYVLYPDGRQTTSAEFLNAELLRINRAASVPKGQP